MCYQVKRNYSSLIKSFGLKKFLIDLSLVLKTFGKKLKTMRVS